MTVSDNVIRLVRDRLAGAEDNLYRFRLAARNTSRLGEQWGESGKTLGEHVADNEAEVAKWKAELAKLEGGSK